MPFIFSIVYTQQRERKNYVSYITPEKKKKRTRTHNHSLLKAFRRFFNGGSCVLQLDAKYLNDLWFIITQP